MSARARASLAALAWIGPALVGCGSAVSGERAASLNEAGRTETALLRFEPSLGQAWNYLVRVEMRGLTPVPILIESRFVQHVTRVGQGEFEVVTSCRSMTSLSPERSELPCSADEAQVLDGHGHPMSNAQQQIQTMLVYPNEPVHAGSTWHEVLRYQRTNAGERTDFELAANYSLVRFEGVGSERVAIVHLDGVLHSQAERGAVADGQIQSDFGVRVRDGLLVSMDMLMPLEVQAGSEHASATTHFTLVAYNAEAS